MKIIRSTKCSLSNTTFSKKQQLSVVLKEYSNTVNFFINYFWNNHSVSKAELLKDIVNLPETWLSHRLRKVAAREALDLISSSKQCFASNKKQLQLSITSIKSKIKSLSLETNSKQIRRKINNLHCKFKKIQNKLQMIQPTMPKHSGSSMHVSSNIAELQQSKNKFDAWLHLYSIGNHILINLPIKFHKHYNHLNTIGKRLNSYIITNNYVQFAFEIETDKKKDVNKVLGVDSGINALASTSDNQQYGLDIKSCTDRIKRRKCGSKGQKTARRALKQRIDEVAKKVVNQTDLLVVENLKNMNNNSKLKGRLSRNIRSSIGSWNYSYWLKRLEMQCESNRVSFRTVSPAYTSQKCPRCGHTSRMNRLGEMFTCQECGYTGNADCTAAVNVLERFIAGPYGACYKHLIDTEFCKF